MHEKLEKLPETLLEINETFRLHHLFRGYANPKAKVRALVRNGTLIGLKRGLYIRADCLDNPRWRACSANRLYGPSYISFQYALRWWGLIPEYVQHITSATFRRNRSKTFETPAGTFFYRDIPPRVYPVSVILESSEQPRFFIASAEKALCDLLYTTSGVRSIRGIEELLFEDLRLDYESFDKLHAGTLYALSTLYRTETLHTLSNYVKRRFSDEVNG